MRKPAATLVLSAFLCGGCTAAYVSGEAIASNKAVEAETNSILVTNILRARDGVPTYFSDISHLRGSLQAQASIQAPLGVGDYKNWTGRSIVAPGAYVQVNAARPAPASSGSGAFRVRCEDTCAHRSS